MEKRIQFDANLCVGCGACVVACMDQNDIYPEKGQPALRRLYRIEGEQVSPRGIYYLSIACQHCADSPCLLACPSGAIQKDCETGSVVVNNQMCLGCQNCATVCPFDVPRFDAEGKMQKCNLCAERVGVNLEPACARVCPMGALSFREILGIES